MSRILLNNINHLNTHLKEFLWMKEFFYFINHNKMFTNFLYFYFYFWLTPVCTDTMAFTTHEE